MKKKESNDEIQSQMMKKKGQIMKKSQKMAKNVICCLLFFHQQGTFFFFSKTPSWRFDEKKANDQKRRQTKNIRSQLFGPSFPSSDLKKKFVLFFNGGPDVPRNDFCRCRSAITNLGLRDTIHNVVIDILLSHSHRNCR